MNFESEAIAWGHGEPKTLPERRFRQRVSLRSSVSGTRWRRLTPAQPRPARGLKRAQVGGEDRLPLALHATRPATAVGSQPSTSSRRGGGSRQRRLRGDGPRFARTFAAFGGQGTGAHGDHTRLSHAQVLHSRERSASRLRRGQAQAWLEGARGAGHLVGHLCSPSCTSVPPRSRTGSR